MTNELPFPRRNFATTHWSVVRNATRAPSQQTRSALETLLQTYWYPVYAFARRQNLSADDAADLTQGFFARLLEKQDLAGADPAKGKFRSYLLGAFRHYLANERDKAAAQKRGGREEILSLEFAMGEKRFAQRGEDRGVDESCYEREWAVALLEETLSGLERAWKEKGKGDLFRRLQPFLVPGEGSPDYPAAAQAAQISEGAFKVAAHRLRQEFRLGLREKLAQTVSGPEELEEEIRDLFRALES